MFVIDDSNNGTATEPKNHNVKEKLKPKRLSTQRQFNALQSHKPSATVLTIHLPYVNSSLFAFAHGLPQTSITFIAFCQLEFSMKGWRHKFDLCTMESDKNN